jgi:hypothetical protein
MAASTSNVSLLTKLMTFCEMAAMLGTYLTTSR